VIEAGGAADRTYPRHRYHRTPRAAGLDRAAAGIAASWRAGILSAWENMAGVYFDFPDHVIGLVSFSWPYPG